MHRQHQNQIPCHTSTLQCWPSAPEARNGEGTRAACVDTGAIRCEALTFSTAQERRDGPVRQGAHVVSVHERRQAGSAAKQVRRDGLGHGQLAALEQEAKVGDTHCTHNAESRL